MIADKLLAALGCVFGAAGIALMALAAHGAWPTIDYAAIMVLAHAPALLLVAVAARLGLAVPFIARLAGFILAGAVALFSAEITLHAIDGGHLFPMAAPIGGSLSIAAWLVLAVSVIAKS